jgi:hypothetical protein
MASRRCCRRRWGNIERSIVVVMGSFGLAVLIAARLTPARMRSRMGGALVRGLNSPISTWRLISAERYTLHVAKVSERAASQVIHRHRVSMVAGKAVLMRCCATKSR